LTDRGLDLGDAPVVFDEDVTLNLLEDAYASVQMVERMAWALGDAEEVERTALPAA